MKPSDNAWFWQDIVVKFDVSKSMPSSFKSGFTCSKISACGVGDAPFFKRLYRLMRLMSHYSFRRFPHAANPTVSKSVAANQKFSSYPISSYFLLSFICFLR